MAALDEEPQGLPRKFGYYVLLHELARGGMGAVYLARTSGLVGIEKWCVIKMLRADLTQDSEYVTRFIDEARVVVTLSHRNICQVFDVGRTDGSYYLAMERVPGRDLRRVLEAAYARGMRIPQPLALHIVGEILEALDYAHRVRDPATGEALGVIHRDVSPANVMLSHEGEVKLVDFGLARSTKKKLKTDPNLVLGKSAYMAPEQMRADALDARADQYAAAVVAYEALTSARYYEGLQPSEIYTAATLGEFRPPLWHTLDAELRSVLERATDPDPARRFESCGAMRDALVAYAHKAHAPSGMRELRALMTQLFPTDGEEFRALLTRLRTALPTVVKSGLGESSVTETIAMSPSSEPELRAAATRAMLNDATVALPVSPASPLFADEISTPEARALPAEMALFKIPEAELSGPELIPPPRSNAPLWLGAAVVVLALAAVYVLR